MEERLPEFLEESSKVPLYCAVSQACYFGLLQNQGIYSHRLCSLCSVFDQLLSRHSFSYDLFENET